MLANSTQDMRALRSGDKGIWSFVAQWIFVNSLLCFIAALLFTNMDGFWL